MISPFLVYNVGGFLYRLPKIPAEREEVAAFRLWTIVNQHTSNLISSPSLALLESNSKKEAYNKFQKMEFDFSERK